MLPFMKSRPCFSARSVTRMPCRHPDKMFPCVESQGILVTDLAEKHGLDFMNGNIVVWFSLILFK